jgi:hypothetical protein
MPLIEVWHYPGSDHYFYSKEEYRDYLRRCAAHNLYVRKVKRMQAARWEILRGFWREARTIQGVVDTLWENTDYIQSLVMSTDELVEAHEGTGKKRKRKKRKPFEWYGIELNVRYNEHASNSHQCPHNGVENWARKDDLPKYYPGYTGQIKLMYSRDPGEFISDDIARCLKRMGVHTGSGGGGDRKHPYYGRMEVRSYEVTLFLDDWEGLRKAQVFQKVQTGTVNGRILAQRLAEHCDKME